MDKKSEKSIFKANRLIYAAFSILQQSKRTCENECESEKNVKRLSLKIYNLINKKGTNIHLNFYLDTRCQPSKQRRWNKYKTVSNSFVQSGIND